MSSFDDYETTADLDEQIYYERLDADMLQAQYEAESRAHTARLARGECDHTSWFQGPDADGMIRCLEPSCPTDLFPAGEFARPELLR